VGNQVDGETPHGIGIIHPFDQDAGGRSIDPLDQLPLRFDRRVREGLIHLLPPGKSAWSPCSGA
jgi:hypothetical protein